MMAQNDENQRILDLIEKGVITPSEGVILLKSIHDETPPLSEAEASTEKTNSAETDFMRDPAPQLGKWRLWWQIPLLVGLGLATGGAILLFWAYQTTNFGWWFYCAWVPFLLGISVMVLAWLSRKAHWLHIRIDQKPGERPARIALSFPLPIRTTAWLLRTFGRYIHPLDQTGLEEIILALQEGTNSRTPLFIEVNEGEEGERVQVYLG